MKLKINKACDLSSISVLPPHSRYGYINKACDLISKTCLVDFLLQLSQYSFFFGCRRTNAISSGTEASVFGKSQGLQLRSQSQHSLSQGMSLSQLSQNSLDEIAMNEQVRNLISNMIFHILN